MSDNSTVELTYESYLQLQKLLDCQNIDRETRFHEEQLFIITHQAFELWFKQILSDVDSVQELLACDAVSMDKIPSGRNAFTIINRLDRIKMILKLLPEQFHILETMTPLDFLNFRGLLGSGSGFQSVQFRLLENRLGLKENLRILYNQDNYKKVLQNNQAAIDKLNIAAEKETLLAQVEQWLERFARNDDNGFWTKYKAAVGNYIKSLTPDDARKQQDIFDTMLDEEKHKEYVSKDERRFSHAATQGALMIMQYRDEPMFQQPFQILILLIDIDGLVMNWRSNHVTMVHRMLGRKPGTGGTSGVQYLRATLSDKYKVFLDLFNLSTFLIPRAYLPSWTEAGR